MKRHIRFPFLLAILISSFLFSDMGSIPFNPRVRVFEPNQRALIAWNGEEEILLLSTDLRASEETEVLEIMPFPSEPVVKKGDIEAFRRAVDLINDSLRHQYRGGSLKADAERGKIGAPAGVVTFHRKIGAHDVSVTRVLNPEGFIKWAEGYLRYKGVENPVIPHIMKSVVQEYLEDGFNWFVFDVVSLGTETITKDAIQFRFETDKLYYPLRITQTEEGWTTIDLIILSPKLLGTFPAFSKRNVEMRHDPLTLSRDSLRDIDKDCYKLLCDSETTKLRIWRIEGYPKDFNDDLIAY